MRSNNSRNRPYRSRRVPLPAPAEPLTLTSSSCPNLGPQQPFSFPPPTTTTQIATLPSFTLSSTPPFNTEKITFPTFSFSDSVVSCSGGNTIPSFGTTSSTVLPTTSHSSSSIIPFPSQFQLFAVKEELQTAAVEAKSIEREAEYVPSNKEPTNSANESIRTSELFPSRTLKGIPQNPHFRSLQCYSRKAREKLILGWDQIFEEAVDQVKSLHSDNFWANVDELWKTLEDLESMGYNVGRLRKRLHELTDVMMKHKCSESEISDLRIKAEDHMKEKEMIESEISNLRAKADKVQVIVDQLMNRIVEMEENLPMVDPLFLSLAKCPL